MELKNASLRSGTWHRRDDLDLEYPHKKSGIAACICNPRMAGHRDRRILGVHWPASLSGSISSKYRKTQSKKKNVCGETQEDSWHWPLLHTRMHTLIWAHTDTRLTTWKTAELNPCFTHKCTHSYEHVQTHTLTSRKTADTDPLLHTQMHTLI